MSKYNCEVHKGQKDCIAQGLENCHWKPTFTHTESGTLASEYDYEARTRSPLVARQTSDEGTCLNVWKRKRSELPKPYENYQISKDDREKLKKKRGGKST